MNESSPTDPSRLAPRQVEQLIFEQGDQSSHIEVQLSRPETPTSTCILYCHGFASSRSGEKAEVFRRSAVASGLAFCSFDFQGHGGSGGAMFDLTLSRNVQDIGRVHGHLLALGFERLVLFGSSMGGGSAVWYAAQHPETIDCAIHIAPALEMDQGLLSLVGEEKATRWQRDGVLFFEHELGGYDLSWDLILDLRSFDRQQLQSAYRTPTLVFQGKHDTSVNWRKVVEFATESEHDCVAVHLMADGDHRLIDRIPYLWDLAAAFLRRRGLIDG